MCFFPRVQDLVGGIALLILLSRILWCEIEVEVELLLYGAGS